jgi:hypothetical protein
LAECKKQQLSQQQGGENIRRLFSAKDKTLGAFSPQTPDQRDNRPFGIPSFIRQKVTAN